MSIRSVLCLFLSFGPLSHAGEYYRCQTPAGDLIFSDRPCDQAKTPIKLPHAPKTGVRPPVTENSRQWTDRVACENRRREADFAITAIRRKNNAIREKQAALTTVEHAELERVSETKGASERKADIRRRFRERDRVYQRVIRDNEMKVRGLEREQKHMKCSGAK